MSYNNKKVNTKGKSSMYIKKNFDCEIPSNIMTSISMWIDCYNSNISEKTKIKGHYEFESKINDTEFMTGSIKMSSSAKKSENEKNKYEKDIYTWLSTQEDHNVDYFSTKISKLMNIDKNVIINSYVNLYRTENHKKIFNPQYKTPCNSFMKSNVSNLLKPIPEIPKVAPKPAPEIPKVAEKVYKDAWDDHFS
jgi:hypothetical protein